MHKLRQWLWIMALAALGIAAVDAIGPTCSLVWAEQSSSKNKSWTDSITSPFKQGFDKVGKALTPAPAPKPLAAEDDAISLKSKSKPGPELYVAIARLYEQGGKLEDAEKQYQEALRLDPKHLAALMGYAQLKDGLGKTNDALDLYLRAAKIHPAEASIHNNLGIFYARNRRFDEAVASLRRAVQMDPKNPRYRNNIATVLVDMGKSQEAFANLSAIYTPAVAYYNLGYLLNKKGETQAAIQSFSLAVRNDPSMQPAQRWVEYLQRSTAQARLANHPAAAGVRVTSEPPKPVSVPPARTAEETAPPMPPDEAMPQRLPPTLSEPSGSDGPSLPGISYSKSPSPIAPLPPVTSSAVRPLPTVR